jgi:deoxyadenosine/deoxycytidine kinase
VVIVIGGMIGIGKTTTAKILHEETGLPVYYETVRGNKILPLFYTASEEEKQAKRYPFLLQLSFLTSRYKAIKEALRNDNAVMDRSIYEDHYFAKKNHDLGNISDLEMSLYDDLLNEMMDELQDLPKKSPNVMVYLKGSFETVLKHIKSRGRSFELDKSLVDYYRFLWKDYDEWVYRSYSSSPVITIDVDKTDLLHNLDDRKRLLEELKKYE